MAIGIVGRRLVLTVVGSDDLVAIPCTRSIAKRGRVVDVEVRVISLSSPKEKRVFYLFVSFVK